MSKRKQHRPPYVAPVPFLLDKPWNRRTWRCEGTDEQGRYGNGFGDSPQQAFVNWGNNTVRDAAIEKLQNEECKIYQHNRRKYDK